MTDLTAQIPASWKTDMLGGSLSSALYEDKYYGVPWGPATKLFYFNTAMLAKVGAKAADVETWDGVLSVAKKLKDAGVVKYPLSWSWSQAEAVICDYAVLLGAFGGSFTDASGKLSVNDGPGVQALTWMCQTITDGLTDPGSVTYLEDDTSKALAGGKAAMTSTGSRPSSTSTTRRSRASWATPPSPRRRRVRRGPTRASTGRWPSHPDDLEAPDRGVHFRRVPHQPAGAAAVRDQAVAGLEGQLHRPGRAEEEPGRLRRGRHARTTT